MSNEKKHPCSYLKEESQKPIDLKQELTPDRINRFVVSAHPFKLLFASERVTESTLRHLYELANLQQVIEKMERMQKGEIMNPFEKRAVLHTACRDVFGAPLEPKASKLAKSEIDKLSQFLKTDTSKDLVLIAIGGSELGPEAAFLALQPYLKDQKHVHFISNIDPDNVTDVFRALDLKKTLVLVVSKSGSTQETKINEAFARKLYRDKGIDPKDHFVAVTTPKSPLDDKARYKEVFHMWDFVGGRYSTSSMAGGVLLAWAFGMDVFLEFLQGAHEMDTHALEKEPSKNLPLTMALLGIWNRNFLNIETNAIIPYSYALRRFPAHLQQVDMESNGKSVTLNREPVRMKTGPIVWGESGTSAQHSFFQLIHQGTDIVACDFIGFLENSWGKDIQEEGTTSQQKLYANLFAQTLALAMGKTSDDPNKVFSGNRPVKILLAKKLDPKTLGALFSVYEHKTAFQGFLWDINSFDQEGVQLGKVLATQIIDAIAGKGGDPQQMAYLNHIEDL